MKTQLLYLLQQNICIVVNVDFFQNPNLQDHKFKSDWSKECLIIAIVSFWKYRKEKGSYDKANIGLGDKG